MASENRRGWNFRKGAKDAPSVEELRERASRGGRARVPKGLAIPEVMEKFQESRRKNRK